MPLLTAEDYLRFARVAPDFSYAYGSHPQQFAELYLPGSAPPYPVIVLVHGGCYREIYGLEPMGAFARALADDGFAVWNMEYRRAGNGGDYPRMFQDVARGTDFLRQIANARGLQLDKVMTVGHSAGGHLALWLAGRHKLPKPSVLYSATALPIAGTVALAAVADIAYAYEQELCSDALPVVMGGEPTEVPAHFRAGSPRELLPLGLPQVHVIGTEDVTIGDNVCRYLSAAEELGEDVELIAIPQAGHFEIVAVETAAFQQVRIAIRALSDKARDNGERGGKKLK